MAEKKKLTGTSKKIDLEKEYELGKTIPIPEIDNKDLVPT